MKKLLLTFAAGFILSSGSAFAQSGNQVEKTFFVKADTWLNEGNKNESNRGSNTTIETRVSEIKDGDNVVGYNRLIGLYSFEYEVPQGMKVQSATIRLVTERRKGGDIYMYGYSNAFAESTSWSAEETYIEEAFASEPIVKFTPAGQSTKAIFDGLNDNYKSLDEWTNMINVTSYVKSVSTTSNSVNILISQMNDKVREQNCFFSKENGGKIHATKEPSFTFNGEDLNPALFVTFVEDANSSTEVLEPISDTWVRSNAANDVYGTNGDIEMMAAKNEDGTLNYHYCGLMSFNLPSEIFSDQYEVTGVQLRLTTTYLKANRNMEIYAYGNDFAEDTKYTNEEQHVTAALAEDPITTFEVKGQMTKAMWDALDENYKNVENWINYIDLTDYVKTLVSAPASRAVNNTRMNLMFYKPNANEATRFASKEAKDIVNEKHDTPLTFAAENLKPMLTVNYEKVDGNTGVDEVAVDENAPVEYYNLQGIRVENPQNGLYIKRQGNKAVKVLIK